MSAFVDFQCKCGRRFGQLLRDDVKVVLCPKCGLEIDVKELNKQLDEARRSILDRVEEDTNRQEKTTEG